MEFILNKTSKMHDFKFQQNLFNGLWDIRKSPLLALCKVGIVIGQYSLQLKWPKDLSCRVLPKFNEEFVMEPIWERSLTVLCEAGFDIGKYGLE